MASTCGKGGQAVVFDIGGVLARINRNWQDAAATAGVTVMLAPEPKVGLEELPAFLHYQAGRVDDAGYIAELAAELGVSEQQALAAHNGILVEPYAGALELVREIHAAGCPTGILSNTNAPHWVILCDPAIHPAIAMAEHKMGSFEVALEKPDPAIYRRYESEFGFRPEEIVFFDDSLPNVEAARACGWRAHRVDPFADPPAQMRDILVSEGVLPASDPR